MVEKVLQINKEKTIFWTLLGILLLSACFYMYFINSTIHNVVARQNLENEAGKLTFQIGNKEFQYITKRNSVNLQLAYSLGFKETEVKQYISRESGTKVAFLSQ